MGWALDNCYQIHPLLNPKHIFQTKIQKCFEDFLSNVLAFPASENDPVPFPSVVESKLNIFVSCIFVLSEHIDFDAMYLCGNVLSSLRAFDLVAGETFLAK